MVDKMKPITRRYANGCLVHCPQCGSLLMIMYGGEAIVHCSVCGTNKKAIVKSGRVTVYELDNAKDASGM